ncbi:related to light induced alcohol dehydrogenase Bli-4 [Phialocephala subalpina]|uniref:Related to light induced alcohol dehydrogenase Bli-4 n=1 Tax=Phialocephala subalpina TaxID=576137 RepID=A0A1L7XFG1_9HELO|nr:related to light induced alcohol dehydrogenase Bli-4 [Phialocephala subalpina]
MTAKWFTDFFYSQLLVTLPYPKTSFSGQIVIVTGSNTGLGLEAARHFVRLNASKVILAVRTLSKGEAAKANILATLPNAYPKIIEIWPLDLSSFESVKQFANKVNGLERLDVVVENAGMATGHWKEVEGNEIMITTNVISTGLLALLVLPKLRESASKYNMVPRLSIVSSELHFMCKFEERKEEDIFAALNRKEGAKIGERYAVSKLLEVFFVRELAKKINESKKPKVIVNCMTPGACKSDFDRESTGLKAVVMGVLKFLIARTTEAGSRTLLAGATAGEESHGQYMTNCVVDKPSPLVLSEEGAVLQKKLWDQLLKKLEVIQPDIEKNI